MTARQPGDPVNPDDSAIRAEWAAWQRAIVHGYDTSAREHREMYLALLERRDRMLRDDKS
jgi:hypothetical protein